MAGFGTSTDKKSRRASGDEVANSVFKDGPHIIFFPTTEGNKV